MKQTILITGATGTIGSHLVEQLKGRSHIRGCYYKQRPEIEGMDWVACDYEKPETIKEAFKEVDKAFLLTPFTDKTVEQAKILVDAAKDAGVKYIIRSSAMGAGENAPFLPGKWHWQAEQLVKKSGIPYAIIRPTFYMQNFINSYGESIRERNSIYSPAGEGKATFIDAYDVAAVATEILTNDGHEGKTYELTGPEAISYADAADILTKKLGRKINYVDITEEQARENFESAGLPDWMIESLLGLAGIIRQGYASSINENVEKITGNKPRTFEQFVQNNIEAFKN